MKDLILKTEKVDWRELVPYQPDDLKKTTPELMTKLKTSLMNNGLASPLNIWEKSGKKYILDSHHRVKALTELESEGKKVPKTLTANFLDIKTDKEAKKLILIFNSHYATIERKGLKSFLEGMDLGALKIEFEPFRLDFKLEVEQSEFDKLSKKAQKDIGAVYNTYAKQALEMYKIYREKYGIVANKISKHAARISFIKALDIGAKYPRYANAAYHPHIWDIPGDQSDYFSGLQAIAESTDKGEHLSFVVGHSSDIDTGLTGTLPFIGYRRPADFDANLCKDIINEHTKKGSKILDPCHGWGGRIVGFLLSHASEYTGFDPSDKTHLGVSEIFKDMSQYTKDKRADLFAVPFESSVLEDGKYDLAITSPPYFDVEKYEGDLQSWKKYPTFELWLNGFYKPLIAKTYAALKPNGIFCLQVGSQRYDLLNIARQYATSTGFEIVSEANQVYRNMQMDTEDSKSQSMLVLKKKPSKSKIKEK